MSADPHPRVTGIYAKNGEIREGWLKSNTRRQSQTGAPSRVLEGQGWPNRQQGRESTLDSASTNSCPVNTQTLRWVQPSGPASGSNPAILPLFGMVSYTLPLPFSPSQGGLCSHFKHAISSLSWGNQGNPQQICTDYFHPRLSPACHHLMAALAQHSPVAWG